MMENRDLKADLELCNKAAREPWVVRERPRYASVVHEIWTTDPETEEICQLIAVCDKKDDAQLIAQAREGWPHAIERAIKAEALAKELVEDLERARGNLLFLLAGAEPDPKRYDIFLRKCTKTLSKAKEVLEDEETCAGRQSTSAKDY